MRKRLILLLTLVLIFNFSVGIFAEGENQNEIRMGTLDSSSKYPFYDEIDSMSEETKNVILNINKNHEDTGAQVGVILLKNLNEANLEETATKLFNTWGLGDKEKNNGALILISKEDRLFRIEVGEGLRRSVLNDDHAAEILKEMVPFCKDGAYNLGVQVGLFYIDNAMINYRGYLEKQAALQEKKEEERKQREAEAKASANLADSSLNNNEKQKSSNFSNNELSDNTILLIFLSIFGGSALIILIMELIKKKREEAEEKRIKEERGNEVEVKIEVTNQFNLTEIMPMYGYEKYSISKSKIENEIRHDIENKYLFEDVNFKNNKITAFEILNIKNLKDNMTYGEAKRANIKVEVELTREEDIFANDKNKIQVTQDFYNSLSPEERAFFNSRATSSQSACRGTNYWYYIYMYMLLTSDRSSSFRGYMDNNNVKSDRFYISAKDIERKEAARRVSKTDDDNDWNNSNSSFSSGSSFYNSGSSFSGFGGGSSSGGGASGGF